MLFILRAFLIGYSANWLPLGPCINGNVLALLFYGIEYFAVIVTWLLCLFQLPCKLSVIGSSKFPINIVTCLLVTSHGNRIYAQIDYHFDSSRLNPRWGLVLVSYMKADGSLC